MPQPTISQVDRDQLPPLPPVTAAVRVPAARVAASLGPLRLHPGRTRRGHTYDVHVGGLTGHLTVSRLPDGRPIEVTLTLGKQGSTLAGLADALSQMISLALQFHIPIAEVVERLVNLRFQPAGVTGDRDVPVAASVADYLARRLAADFLTAADRARLGLPTGESQLGR